MDGNYIGSFEARPNSCGQEVLVKTSGTFPLIGSMAEYREYKMHLNRCIDD